MGTENFEGRCRRPNKKFEGKYGYRHIYLALRMQGYVINHKKVQRIMRNLGLKCFKFRRKSRYNSYKGHVAKVSGGKSPESQVSYAVMSSKACDRYDGIQRG
ncbi:IS3 family transposase [Bacillus sp. FJAT-27916]|uniref:IS3 family transposase n=1 Tax=Bacillus sp. FJAT-27916 TaxID=1679169 RepID=UPI0009E40D02